MQLSSVIWYEVLCVEWGILSQEALPQLIVYGGSSAVESERICNLLRLARAAQHLLAVLTTLRAR